MSTQQVEIPDSDGPSATFLAIRNAFTLGGALVFTWGIALGIRIVVPRHLGPTAFGELNFADAFTSMFFVMLDLGLEPVHPQGGLGSARVTPATSTGAQSSSASP